MEDSQLFYRLVNTSYAEALSLVRNFVFKYQDRVWLNEAIENMSAEKLGNIIFIYFKDINRTFRIEMDTRFVSFDRLTLNDTVNKVNTNSLLRDVITGNSRDVLMSELQKKWYQKNDINDKMKELEGKIAGM